MRNFSGNYGGRDPTSDELQRDVDRLLGALDAPMQTGLHSGGHSPYVSRTPVGGLQHEGLSGLNSGRRSPVTGGYASGQRTPNPGNYSTPGERFATHGSLSQPLRADPVRFQHMDAVLESLGGDSEAGYGLSGHSEPSSGGALFEEFRPHNFPEQSSLVMPAENDEDELGSAAIDRLHKEMDALLADTGTAQLSAEQQMLLRQNEISNRAQMEAFRVPVTASIDRVMTRSSPHQSQEIGGMPPQVHARQQRQQDDYDTGTFGFRCFRACS